MTEKSKQSPEQVPCEHIISGPVSGEALERELLTAMSHDLRTPLTSIKGYASMILDYETKMKPEVRRSSLTAIIRASDRMVALIDQIIDIAQSRNDPARLEKNNVNLRYVITSALDDIRQRMPDYIFTVVLKKLPRRLKLDEHRIRQVLENFLDNAVRHSPPGGRVTVRAGTTDNEVIISFHNEKYGLPEQTPPQSSNDNTGSNESGTLGLPIILSQAVIAMHGGRIWSESTGETGNTYCFSLPVSE